MSKKSKGVLPYVEKYKDSAALVFSSRGKVGSSGRWGDADDIAFHRARHAAVMASLGVREVLLDAARHAVALGMDQDMLIGLTKRAFQIASASGERV